MGIFLRRHAICELAGERPGKCLDGSGGILHWHGTQRNTQSGASYFIPNENEWYKAAYHKNDGVTANYWDYPTSADAVPFSDQPPGSGAPVPSQTANFFLDDSVANGYNDGYALTGSTIYSSTQNYLSDVGAYPASVGPYGTFDQGGNVSEFNEGGDTGVLGSLINRRLRGGTWSVGPFLMSAATQSSASPSVELLNIGFRVASIPEPGSALLGALGVAGLLLRRGGIREGTPTHDA